MFIVSIGIASLLVPTPRYFAVLILTATICFAEDDRRHVRFTIIYDRPEHLADLHNVEINESSGVSASLRHDNVFWTHNDSGDGARIFAFDGQGKDRGTCRIEGAEAIDWEDMASFRQADKDWLLLADVGDNGRRREVCLLYLVFEPDLAERAVTVQRTIRFRYENGPRDCEAVAVDTVSGCILLAAKGGVQSEVYALPLGQRAGEGVVTATRVAKIGVPLVTAMDVSPDGRRAVILTYGPAFEYSREPDEDWQQALAREPRQLPMPVRRQGESICYGPDGRTLYLTSEKLPTPLWKIAPQAADVAQ